MPANEHTRTGYRPSGDTSRSGVEAVSVAEGTEMALDKLKAVVKWPIEQVKGWWKNATKIAKDLTWEDAIPPALLSSIEWTKEKLLLSLGTGTPQEQMASSFALGVAAWVSSALSLGLTIPVALFFTLTFAFGSLRLWPIVDDTWPFGSAGPN